MGIIESILTNRGIKDFKHFLKPVEEDLLPSIDLSNIKEAAEIVIQAIKEGKRIHILPDIDVDGCSAGAIMYQYILPLNKNVSWSINVGKKHGLNSQDLESYIDKYDLVIAVDSSSNDIEQQKFLKEHGIDVVILDHHPFDNKSKYATIVNCTDGGYKNPFLSGSAVTLKFVQYLDELLGINSSEQFWDLATSGLVGDMMPLGEENAENRYICYKGFSNLKNVALKEIIGKYTFNSTSVAYSIAPLINAAQRMYRNELAFELLIESDKAKVKKIILKLKELKEEQDILKNKMVKQIEKTIEKDNLDKDKIIGLIVENPPMADITGLVATGISSDYKHCTILVHKTEDEGILRGSIRGYGVSNFKDLINNTKLVEFCEGHMAAAGLGIKEDKFNELISKLNEILKDLPEEPNIADIILEPKEITFDLIKKSEYVNLISGEGFKPITIMIKDVEPKYVTGMQNKHTKFEYRGLKFLKWNSKLYEDLKCDYGIYKTLDVIGTLSEGNFRGERSKQLIINDIDNLQENLEFLR